MSTTSVPTARRRLVAGAALALTVVMAAGCSSSSDQKSGAKHLKRAAATKHVDDAKKTPSTTAAPAPSTTTTPAGPTCPTEEQVSPLLGGDRVNNVSCLGTFAAGGASNPVYDYAYLLTYADGAWTRASNAVAQDVCTTNSYGLPASFVAEACND